MRTPQHFILTTIFLTAVCVYQSTLAQESIQNNISIMAAVGLQESIVAGLNMPLTESIDVGVKANRIITGGGSRRVLYSGLGVGVTSSYQYTDADRFLNVVNLDLSYLYRIFEPNSPSSGLNYQLTIGHRNNTEGIHLYWGVGIGLTTFSNSASYILPCLQGGVQWNL